MKRKNLKLLISVSTLLCVMSSCATNTTLEDREITRSELSTTEVLGSVRTEFISVNLFYSRNNEFIKNKAYERLLEAAREKYGPTAQVRNIRIKPEFTPYTLINLGGGVALGLLLGIPLGEAVGGAVYRESYDTSAAELAGYGFGFSSASLLMLMAGNTQKMVATGDVIVYKTPEPESSKTDSTPSYAPTYIVPSPTYVVPTPTPAVPTPAPTPSPTVPSGGDGGASSGSDSGSKSGATSSSNETQTPSLVITKELETALVTISNTLQQQLVAGSTIAILSMSTSSQDQNISVYILDELEFQMVNSRKFKVVDRKTVDQIKREQQFQLSGDVDDDAAVSIGKMLGATIVITGTVNVIGTTQRIVIKALDVQTAEIISMLRETF